MYQVLKESATAFKVDPTKMLAWGNKKGRIPYTELLEEKNPAEIDAIQIPAATRGHNNTNIYFTKYTSIPPFIPKKILEDKSSTSQEIVISYVKAQKSFESTQAAIATLINAPANTAPEAQPTVAPAQTTSKLITTNKV